MDRSQMDRRRFEARFPRFPKLPDSGRGIALWFYSYFLIMVGIFVPYGLSQMAPQMPQLWRMFFGLVPFAVGLDGIRYAYGDAPLPARFRHLSLWYICYFLFTGILLTRL